MRRTHMPTPKELLDAGDLNAAIEALTQEVREAPTDPQKRTFLFELLAFAGEWDRAEKQVAAVAGADAPSQMATGVYRGLLQAERDRARVFAGKARPHFLREVPSYVEKSLAAIGQISEGNFAAARALLDEAEEERPSLSGKRGEEAFGDLRDFDDVLAGVVEMVFQGKYTWFPLEQAKSFEPNPPKKLRDLIWPGAHITADDGTSADVFLFALYPGSAAHADNLVKLGRMTDWKSLSDDLQTGLGLRSFLVDDTDVSLFELGPVDFDPREDLQS
jgi:type VI secretion system protein ImpE